MIIKYYIRMENIKFNLDYELAKIRDLLLKGETVKMKNKEKFKLTLSETRVLLFN